MRYEPSAFRCVTARVVKRNILEPYMAESERTRALHEREEQLAELRRYL